MTSGGYPSRSTQPHNVPWSSAQLHGAAPGTVEQPQWPASGKGERSSVQSGQGQPESLGARPGPSVPTAVSPQGRATTREKVNRHGGLSGIGEWGEMDSRRGDDGDGKEKRGRKGRRGEEWGR